ncbi:hypothetical protein ABK046_47085, partial [Streptomyces caeruleatus]
SKMGLSTFSRQIHLDTWGIPLDEAIAIRSPGINISEFNHCFKTVMKQYVKSGKLDFIPEENLKALDELIEKGEKVILLTSRGELELEH